MNKSRSSSPLPRRRQEGGSDLKPHSDLQNRSYVRNRTLSPFTSIDETPRAQTHTLTATRRRIGGIFAFIVAIIIFLVFILFQFTAQVTVGISQTDISKNINNTEYVNAISTYLNQHPVERLRFALSDAQLMAYMETVHPEVASIKQTTAWNIGSTSFQITLRQPVAGWQLNGKQYYVDNTGVAFQQNFFTEPSVQIIDQSNTANTTGAGGATVTSSRFLSFIGQAVSIAKGRGYTITQAVLPVGTTREVAFHLAGIPTEIRMTVDRGVGVQMEDMDRSLKYLKGKGITPQYIDVRIQQRAYYK